MPSKLLHKNVWKNAVGAFKKPRRLHLVADADGYFYCPVHNCDTDGFRSQRGCRKHVFMKHGWYYYFHEKPSVDDVLPAQHLRTNSRLPRTKRSTTSQMPMFLKTCCLSVKFKRWLKSAGGGGKSDIQAE